jgi:hypothetical protein
MPFFKGGRIVLKDQGAALRLQRKFLGNGRIQAENLINLLFRMEIPFPFFYLCRGYQGGINQKFRVLRLFYQAHTGFFERPVAFFIVTAVAGGYNIVPAGLAAL